MKRAALGLALLAAAPATGAELFAASGPWVGEGRLATGVAAPLERGRCRVEITPDGGAGTVDVIGTCAVAVGKSDISLKLLRAPGGVVRAGVWTAATDQVVQYAGKEVPGRIVLDATTPLVVDGVAHETRVEVEMLDAARFTFRQLLRAEGADAWRLVAEMTYRPAAG